MIDNNRIISIITARAGSKGVKGKNFRSIHGKPLIYWSIEASLRSKHVDLTTVSSNDPEIEKICHEWEDNKSFRFIKRPEEMCGPNSSNEEAMIHAYKEVGQDFDSLILLQPTSPARRDNLIDRCIQKLYDRDNDNDSCFTASKHTPFFYRIDITRQRVIPTNSKCVNRPMRQDLLPSDWYWHDNGNIYLTKSNIFFKRNNRMGDRVTIMETDFFSSLQIDTEEDFKVMEKLAELYGGFI